jgi:hypothetical protein
MHLMGRMWNPLTLPNSINHTVEKKYKALNVDSHSMLKSHSWETYSWIERGDVVSAME